MDGIGQTEKGILLQVRSNGTPRYPACSGSDIAYHSIHLRSLGDLPWPGQPVRIQVKTRRFSVSQSTLSTPDLRRKAGRCRGHEARETDRLTQNLGFVGYLLGPAGIASAGAIGM